MKMDKEGENKNEEEGLKKEDEIIHIWKQFITKCSETLYFIRITFVRREERGSILVKFKNILRRLSGSRSSYETIFQSKLKNLIIIISKTCVLL